MESEINFMENWYSNQCNGYWEHQYGIEITTLDNPGWQITIDLAQTRLETLAINPINIKISESDWEIYLIKDKKFIGAGDPSKLNKILSRFKMLIEGEK